jgi:hypothetical protein
MVLYRVGKGWRKGRKSQPQNMTLISNRFSDFLRMRTNNRRKISESDR